MSETTALSPALAVGPAASETRPVPYRGAGFVARPLGIIGPIVFVVLIALWELGSRTGVISQLVLPAPSEAFEAFRQLIETGKLRKHLGASLNRLVVGWSVSFMSTDQLIAGVAMLSVMGLTMAWLIGKAEHYFLRWRL